jgi:hypothetical protein
MSAEKKEARRTAEFLKSAPTHFKYWNDKQRQHAEKEAADFRAAFAEGKCSVCGQPITSYTKSEPCLHWLLRPPNLAAVGAAFAVARSEHRVGADRIHASVEIGPVNSITSPSAARR